MWADRVDDALEAGEVAWLSEDRFASIDWRSGLRRSHDTRSGTISNTRGKTTTMEHMRVRRIDNGIDLLIEDVIEGKHDLADGVSFSGFSHCTLRSKK